MNTPVPAARFDRSHMLGAALGVTLALAGCASNSSDPAAANAGLDSLASETAPKLTASVPAVDTTPSKLNSGPELSLGEIFDRAPRETADAGSAGRPSSERSTPEVPAPAAEPPKSAPATPQVPALASKSPQQRRSDAAEELRALLRDSADGSTPFSTAVRLAALNAISPPTPASPSFGAALAPTQQQALGMFVGLLTGLTTGAANTGDPAAAARVLDEAALAMSASQSVRVAKVALCKRVLGFGQYDPFPSNTFLGARANRALVYVELDRFSHRSARESDPGSRDQGWSASTEDPLWAVEVSEELALYHDADGSLQWRKPEQAVTEVSRNRRHDFYLVQTIDLPATLSVGDYRLKVTIRDKTSGSTDEVSIPIRVLADATGAVRTGK